MCGKCTFQFINVLKCYICFQVCIDERSKERLGCSYLFNVQEVFGFEGYGHALHRNVITGARVITDICPHSKRHRFSLEQ